MDFFRTPPPIGIVWYIFAFYFRFYGKTSPVENEKLSAVDLPAIPTTYIIQLHLVTNRVNGKHDSHWSSNANFQAAATRKILRCNLSRQELDSNRLFGHILYGLENFFFVFLITEAHFSQTGYKNRDFLEYLESMASDI